MAANERTLTEEQLATISGNMTFGPAALFASDKFFISMIFSRALPSVRQVHILLALCCFCVWW